MTGRALMVWTGILVLANLNGAFRELVLVPQLGAMPAHLVSTIALSAAVLLGTWFTIGWIAPSTPRAAVGVGLLWLALTLAFEFLVGHFVFGTSWQALLADYDVAAGRLWPLVLVVVVIAPWLAATASGHRRGSQGHIR